MLCMLICLSKYEQRILTWFCTKLWQYSNVVNSHITLVTITNYSFKHHLKPQKKNLFLFFMYNWNTDAQFHITTPERESRSHYNTREREPFTLQHQRERVVHITTPERESRSHYNTRERVVHITTPERESRSHYNTREREPFTLQHQRERVVHITTPERESRSHYNTRERESFTLQHQRERVVHITTPERESFTLQHQRERVVHITTPERESRSHYNTRERVVHIMHYSPGCVHSNSCQRSSPGGSLTICTTLTHIHSNRNTSKDCAEKKQDLGDFTSHITYQYPRCVHGYLPLDP